MKRASALFRASSLVFFVASTSSSGWACSFGDKTLTKDQIAVEATKAFQRASLVVDAEVVMPMAEDVKTGTLPAALLRVLKTWKGKADDEVIVVYLSSCDITLRQSGQKMRILLSGEGIFRAYQGMNWGIGGDQADFNAAIDRLIGSERPATFIVPGVIEQPPAE